MAAVDGTYVLEKNDNLEALLKAIGAKEERLQKMVAAKPTAEIKLSGDKLTIHSKGEEEVDNVITLGAPSTFKLVGGLELDINVSLTGNKSITGTISKGKHAGTITVEFDGAHLTETFCLGGITAKRVYKKT